MKYMHEKGMMLGGKRTHTYGVCLTSEDERMLRELSDELGLTKSAVVRMMIHHYSRYHTMAKEDCDQRWADSESAHT